MPTRLVNAPGADPDDPTRGRAAELLRALQAPPARLSPSARARIAARLDEQAARQTGPRRIHWPAAVAAVVVLGVGLFVGSAVGAAWGLAPPRWLSRWWSATTVTPPRHAVAPPAAAPPPEVAAATAAPPVEVAPVEPILAEPRRAHPAHASRAHEAAAPAEDPVVAESRVLAGALQDLRQRHDPQAALSALDEYERRFPAGALAPEAAAARIDALLALGRRAQALQRLEALPLEHVPRGAELRALRGELRAGRGELGAALDDFSVVIAQPGAPPGVVERALFGRGSCRSRLGDVAGARADLTELLRRFPGGPFAEPARRALRD
jgi:hypothetical protein